MHNSTTSSSKPAKIRLLLVDDHILMRIGLASAARNEPDMDVVAQAEDGEEAIKAFRIHQPDVVILDLRMPKKNGIETITALRKEFGSVRVLVLSNYGSGEEVANAMQAGASGFVGKDTPLESLFEAIRQVHSGQTFLPADMAQRVARRLISDISSREIEVLALVSKGKSNKEIAVDLGVAEATVRNHLTSILSKLQAADRTQAVLIAIKNGLLHLE